MRSKRGEIRTFNISGGNAAWGNETDGCGDELGGEGRGGS